MTTLNAAVAEQLIEFKATVDKEMAAGKAMNIAIMDTLKPIIKSIIDVVCFDGNGYTDEWKAEACRRGLDVETSVPEMFRAFTTPKAIKMFTELGVYTEKELHARNEVKWETYTKKVQIEARVIGRMALNHIIPAALAYQTKLLKNISLMKEVYADGYAEMASVSMGFVSRISELVSQLRVQVDAMVNARKAANKIEDEYLKAKAYHEIAESLFKLRRSIDKLEEIVDNDMWPLPKYRELLFIN
jgi:glutamine synthetase